MPFFFMVKSFFQLLPEVSSSSLLVVAKSGGRVRSF